MISCHQVQVLSQYFPDPGIRPNLACIGVNKWYFCATDSFRVCRTELESFYKEKSLTIADTPKYPDVDAFLWTHDDWKNITKYMRIMLGQIAIFWKTQAIIQGTLDFERNKITIIPFLPFNDSDTKYEFFSEHPFVHTATNMFYFLEMLKPFKKSIEKGTCHVEYRQDNPNSIMQFRFISPIGNYEIGIMPKKK